MASKRALVLVSGDGGGEGKRLRVTVPGAGGSGGGQAPGTQLLRQTVLALLFLLRMSDKVTVTESISQIGRMVQKIHNVQSIIISKLGSIEERIEFLTHKVDQITPPRSNHCNHQRLMHEANKEGTSTEGLTENEGEGKSTSVRLRFLNGMKSSVYHDDEIKAENNEAIKVGIFDGEQIIESGPLSKARVEILALEGNFPYDDMDSWTSAEFNKYRAVCRDGKSNVLAGNCTPRLINGVASLSTIKFREGSCKARKGMFIVGARVSEDAITGPRVQEAVMKPVVVQDRRNKFNEKSHPPKLDDRVDRLQVIAGTFCKRLEEKHIFTVQDFLRALNKNPENLAKVLCIKMEHKYWKKMVKHARECSIEGKHELKSYRCAERNVMLFFNCVHFLVGAAFGECYTASDKFDQAQQVIVVKLKQSAYEQLDALPFDYIMEGDLPVPYPMTANAGAGAGAGAGPSFFMSSASQPNHSGHHYAYQGVDGLSHAQIESSCANANNGPSSFSIPDHYNTLNYQDQGTQQPGEQQFSLASLYGCHQNPLRELNYSHGITEGLCTGAEDDEVALLLNQELFTSQSYCVAPGFDQVETQRQNF